MCLDEREKLMCELKGKRLLVLGGSYCKDAIRQFADEYGVYLIAAGNSPDAGIVKVSDEYHNVNSTDSEHMSRLISHLKIDGVYLGSSEPVINKAVTYVAENGFPCYCTKEQWETLQNKGLLKELFQKFGLPVVPRYKYSYDQLDDKSAEIDFPVITKPADGCGSSGFSVCNNIEELKKGYLSACENSASGEVIIEKYVDNKGIVAFFSFTEGKMVFLGAEDKYPRKYKEDGSFVAGLLIFESRFKEDFERRYCDKLAAMFSSLGLKEGTVWIEIFTNGENYYFNEAGYRYGGSVTVYPIDYLYGVNQVYADMYYALTGKSNLYNYSSLLRDDMPQKRYYAIYPLYAAAGRIAAISGADELYRLPSIAKVIVNKAEGDVIKNTGDFSQNLALIHFVFDDKAELDYTIDYIHRTFAVKDDKGNEALVGPVNTDDLNICL